MPTPLETWCDQARALLGTVRGSPRVSGISRQALRKIRHDFEATETLLKAFAALGPAQASVAEALTGEFGELVTQLDEAEDAATTRSLHAQVQALNGRIRDQQQLAMEQAAAEREAAIAAQLEPFVSGMAEQRARVEALDGGATRRGLETALQDLQARRDIIAGIDAAADRDAAVAEAMEELDAFAGRVDEADRRQQQQRTFETRRVTTQQIVDRAQALLASERDSFDPDDVEALESAVEAVAALASAGRWAAATGQLGSLRSAAETILQARIERDKDPYQARERELAASIDASEAAIDELIDKTQPPVVQWKDAAAGWRKARDESDWPTALEAINRLAELIPQLDALENGNFTVMRARTEQQPRLQRALQLLKEAPDNFPAGLEAELTSADTAYFEQSLLDDWDGARQSVQDMTVAIDRVLNAHAESELFQQEFNTDIDDMVKVLRLVGKRAAFPPGTLDAFNQAYQAQAQAMFPPAPDWPSARRHLQTVKDEAARIVPVVTAGAAYYEAMASVGTELAAADELRSNPDSRLVHPLARYDGVQKEIADEVAAGQWDLARDRIPELTAAARGVVDALDESSGKLEFEIALGQIAGLQRARATVAHPPPGLSKVLIDTFNSAYRMADQLRSSRDFGTHAQMSAQVLELVRAATAGLDTACRKLADERSRYDAEVSKLTQLAAAREWAQAGLPALEAQARLFNAADELTRRAAAAGRWDLALAALADLSTAADDLLAERSSTNASANDNTWPALQQRLDGFEPRITKAAEPTKAAVLQRLQAEVATRAETVRAAIGNKDLTAAEAALLALERALAACEKGRADHAAVMQRYRQAADGEVKAAREVTSGNGQLESLRAQQHDAAARRIVALADDGQWAEADRAIRSWVDQAKAWVQSEEAFRTMNQGSAPDTRKLSALMALPGGAEVFDQIVENLPAQRPQSVMKQALTARYGFEVKQFENKNPDRDANLTGLKAVEDKLPDKSLQALYAVLGEVPIAHIKDKVKELVRFAEEGGGGSYAQQKVYLYCGRSGEKGNEKSFGAPGTMVPDDETVDEACQPANKDPVDFFKFAALHEVGHAEDDSAKHSTALAGHAGWLTHSADEVAAIVVGKLGYDLRYVKAMLGHKSSQVPDAKPAPQGKKTPEAWEAERVAVERWCRAVREAEHLWDNAAASRELAIDGRVYHESYRGKWVSYQYSARAQGISTYQFRSPSEWFAELYAAYYSRKLKANHPATAWLAKL